ncbi:MAG: YIP1 family protein [Pseudomonadota bacterium]
MFELVKDLLGLTLVDPRAAARKVIALDYDAATLATIASLLIVVAAMLSTLFSPGIDPADESFMGLLARNPLVVALLEIVVFVIVAIALWKAGGIFGGTGTFGEVLSVATWNQMISLVVQIFLILLILFIPPLVGPVFLLTFAWRIYVFVVSLQVAHDFDNIFVTAGVILLSLMGVLFVAGIVAMVFGLYPQGAVP